MSRCRGVASSLLSVLQELARLDSVPQSASEAQQLIAQHDACVRAAVDDPKLAHVQQEATEVLHRLRGMGDALNYCRDYT